MLSHLSLVSGVTLRGFDSQVSGGEFVGKTHASDSQRIKRP